MIKRLMRFSFAIFTCLLVMTLVAGCVTDSEKVPSTLHQPTVQPTPTPEKQAEYAIRWDVNEGGPKTANDVLAILGDTLDKPEDYEVQYFDFTPPADTPAGVTAILRQRKKGKKKFELTFKYRSDRELVPLKCPISDIIPNEPEVDITFLNLNESKRAYSSSCTIETENTPAIPPAALAAQLKSCLTKMTRLKTNSLKLKIEEWHLPGGVIILEVSKKGTTSASELASFQQDVVKKLLDAGVKPSQASKTELGSSCQ